MNNSLFTQNKDLMGGTLVFKGTRVPVKTFFDYLEHGKSIDDFLEDFPTINRKQAIDVLEYMKTKLVNA